VTAEASGVNKLCLTLVFRKTGVLIAFDYGPNAFLAQNQIKSRWRYEETVGRSQYTLRSDARVNNSSD